MAATGPPDRNSGARCQRCRRCSPAPVQSDCRDRPAGENLGQECCRLQLLPLRHGAHEAAITFLQRLPRVTTRRSLCPGHGKRHIAACKPAILTLEKSGGDDVPSQIRAEWCLEQYGWNTSNLVSVWSTLGTRDGNDLLDGRRFERYDASLIVIGEARPKIVIQCQILEVV